MDDDGQVLVFEVLIELIAQFWFGTNQMNAYRKRAAGQNSSTNLRFRCFVRTTGVKRDVDEQRRCSDYLTASLVSSTERPLYSPHLGQA